MQNSFPFLQAASQAWQQTSFNYANHNKPWGMVKQWLGRDQRSPEIGVTQSLPGKFNRIVRGCLNVSLSFSMVHKTGRALQSPPGEETAGRDCPVDLGCIELEVTALHSYSTSCGSLTESGEWTCSPSWWGGCFWLTPSRKVGKRQ